MESPLGPLAPAHLSEFVVGLVLAILVAVVVQMFVVPRFEAMYGDRAAEIEGGINRAQVIRAEAEKTKRQYQEQLARSREESARLREEARAQGAVIVEEARLQAQQEAARIIEAGRQQLDVEYGQAHQELRREVGALAAQLAERIIGESLTDSALTQRTVDRFLAELAQQPSRQLPDYVPDDLASREQ
ncbi:F0F1 ATP synthase subunit B [Brooklawnia sp.]|uniref:F0F1 ATP synthase subunit B n=1 Tax=Brooklawnia sp. TaxID=2699740 RepID=UPI003C763446